jgi:hypothetical protein
MNSTHPVQSSDDAALNRREFLGRGVRFTIAVALGPACMSGATPAEAAGPLVKFAHGTGVQHAPFYAGEKKLFAKYGANAGELTVRHRDHPAGERTGRDGGAAVHECDRRVPRAELLRRLGSGIQGRRRRDRIKSFADLKGRKSAQQVTRSTSCCTTT